MFRSYQVEADWHLIVCNAALLRMDWGKRYRFIWQMLPDRSVVLAIGLYNGSKSYFEALVIRIWRGALAPEPRPAYLRSYEPADQPLCISEAIRA